MYRVLVSLALLLMPFILFGQYNSATANALSGLSILSESVADYAYSPVLGKTGISSNYHRPFNTSGIDILGLHSAISEGNFIFAIGTSYLHHEDYCQQNPYLNINYRFKHFRIGASGHLFYDAIEDEDGEYEFSYDIGLAYNFGDYQTALQLLQKGYVDERLNLSFRALLDRQVSVATGYQIPKEGKNYLMIGIRAELNDYFVILSSWQSLQNRFGAGLSLKVAQWTLNYGIRSHPDLDYSHAISLDYSW
nr:hypothetical protein [Candidatus Cloacimonadota bacterium]